MRTLRAWVLRFGGLFQRARKERELTQEIESHLQLHIDDLVRSGFSQHEARRVALIKFGGVEATKEASRERRAVPFLEDLARDVFYAFRMLGSHKGWAAVAVLSLALGIGANTALFNVVNPVLLKKLPVRDPDQLVAFRWVGDNSLARSTSAYGFVAAGPSGQSGASFTFHTFQELKRANQTLADLFAFAPGTQLNLIYDGGAETASSQFVSGGFYSGLGILAHRGRLLDPADDLEGAEPALVISHEYWKRRFGMNPEIIGKSVTINGLPATIVGIAPPGVGDMRRIGRTSPDVTLALALEPRLWGEEASKLRQAWNWWLLIMGRLNPEATPKQVEANLAAAFRQAGLQGNDEWASARSEQRQSSDPLEIPDVRIVVGSRGVYDSIPSVERQMKILAAVLGTLLLVVCLNLANLLLSRTESRQREIAVRMAIGAGRTRVIRQFLTESAVLAAFGGAAGLLVASVCQQLLEAYTPLNTPAGFDWATLVFASSVSLGTVLIFGLAPALQAARLECGQVMQEANSRTSHGRSRLGKSLVVVQVALSLVLLVSAGLFLETLVNLQRVNPGFNPDNLALLTIDPQLGRYDETRAAAVYDELLERLAALPGVHSVSFSSAALLSQSTWSQSIRFEGRDSEITSITLTVHPDFFKTMEIPLKLGRGLTAGDRREAPPVAVVNEAFARAFLPHSVPVAARFGRPENPSEVEIVGVVADTHYRNLREPAEPIFYRPHLQRPGGRRTFLVRTAGEPEAMVPSIRETVRQVDASLPLLDLTTQRATIERNWVAERVFAIASSLFGGLALVISAIGLFGLMSYLVARRTREIGIRMALGAEQRGVLNWVMSEALALVAIGIVIGLGVALASTRFLEGLLFGLAPNDPRTIVTAALVMLTVAALAGYIPARRASRVDPMVALRHE